jgi:hypothetical protein
MRHDAHVAVEGKRDPDYSLTCQKTSDVAFGMCTVAGDVLNARQAQSMASSSPLLYRASRICVEVGAKYDV